MAPTSFVFPNDVHPAWSIMIVLYPFMTGLVLGNFAVSALYFGFRRRVFEPVARLALVTSLCFCACATLPLLLHLRHPERALNVMITPNTTSAMAMFGFAYSAFMLLLLVEVWLVFRPAIVSRGNSGQGWAARCCRALSFGTRQISAGAQAADAWMIRALAIAGIPLACVLSGYVGFLFCAIKGNPWWSTALLPFIFLVSALASGIAALITLYLLVGWWQSARPQEGCLRALCRGLWIVLATAVSLEIIGLWHASSAGGAERKVIETLIHERLAVSLGVVQLLFGSALPLILLLPACWSKTSARRMTQLAALAAPLVVMQVLAMRWNVVVGGQLFSKSFRGFVEYGVGWLDREGLVAAAIVLALPLAALWVAAKILPLWHSPEK